MAVGPNTKWYIRQDGSDTNGGGYDATLSGATTNYCDRASPFLTLTDLATSGAGSTTLTSTTGGFTASLIGNCWRIDSGTNFDTGYYFVTAVGSSTSCTLDRSPTSGGAGSGGHGKIGGAFASIIPMANGGNAGTPPVDTPIQSGNIIMLRGSGIFNPATPDYTATGYSTIPNGGDSNGCITIQGYNGMPCYATVGLFIYQGQNIKLVNIKFITTTADNGTIIQGASAYNCIFDQNGIDMRIIDNAESVIFCMFMNTGDKSEGSTAALIMSGYANCIYRCYFKDLRGWVVDLANGVTFIGNIVDGCRTTSQGAINNDSSDINDSFRYLIADNTIMNNSAHAIVSDGGGLYIFNNEIHNNRGVAVNLLNVDANTAQHMRQWLSDYNNFYNNASGNYSANLTTGVHDTALPPVYNAQLLPGRNIRSRQFNFTGTSISSYPDCGAIQHFEDPKLRGR